MSLNEIGTVANECRKEIPKHFPNAVLHEHIVRPNHVHGIIELAIDAVGKRHGVSLQLFGKPIPGSLSVIVNPYKS